MNKNFAVTISDNEISMENAMRMDGYSHISQPRKITSASYPFERWVRDVYVTGANERGVCRQAERVIVFGLVAVREVFPQDITSRLRRLREKARAVVVETPAWTVEGKQARAFA